MGRRRRQGFEEGLGQLTRESAALATRLSWKGAALLGLALFVVVGVLIPYAIEFWAESQMQGQPGTPAGLAGTRLHRFFVVRAIVPMKVIGAIAGIACLLISIYKLLLEIRNR